MNIFPEPKADACNGVHAMIDIETLSTRVDSPIISIGAVIFDPQANDTHEKLMNRAFLRLIDIDDAIKVCGPASGSTLKWWLGQKDAAIKRLIEGDAVPVKTALQDLWRYTHTRGKNSLLPPGEENMPIPTNVWAKSPSFDMKIINEACDKVGVKNPFFFSIERCATTAANVLAETMRYGEPAPDWAERCVRTIQDLAFPNGEFPEFTEGVHHDARDDAVNQALMVQACYRALGMGRDPVDFHKW